MPTRLIALLLSLLCTALSARPIAPDAIPPDLAQWRDWVLHEHPDRNCPSLYNRDERLCAWPSRLAMDLDEQGGAFLQQWQVEREGWVPLPGGGEIWPQSVKVGNQPAIVTERNGQPVVRLEPGNHVLEGLYRWQRLPDAIPVPDRSGLLEVAVDQAPLIAPELVNGRLLLRGGGSREEAPAEENRLELRVFRKVIDDHPMQLITHIELDVAGRPREAILGQPLLDGFIPLRLDAPLPARLEADGGLRVQLRPGQWRIQLSARHPDRVTLLQLPEQAEPWPREEVWSFEARNPLRLVEIKEVRQLDPRRTGLPTEWRQLPAYHMTPQERFTIDVVRRGDPDPEANRLNLEREMWLDFDGGGYTLRDRISGVITRDPRLEASPELHLGRVVIDDQPRFITRADNATADGVEARYGGIEMVAEGRLEGAIAAPPASGWQSEFQQLQTTLHLPPGWRLLTAAGVDNRPNTWINGWTLLDLFLVLIAAVAAGRLWGVVWGLAMLVGLALIWHEPNAPRFIWLNLLAAIALLRVLPTGRARRWIGGYRNLSLLALALLMLPFLVQQVRSGLYPQLERGGGVSFNPMQQVTQGGMQADMAMEQKAETLPMSRAPAKVIPQESMEPSYPRKKPSRYDANAVIQTGPGLPNWNWRRVSLSWNGAVDSGQRLQLVYLSPAGLLIFKLQGCLLALLLAVRLLDRPLKTNATPSASPALWLLLLMPLLTLAPVDRAQAADYPSPELLKALEQRLTAPAECLPACAQIPKMTMTAGQDRLTLELEIHAQQTTAIPLPVDPRRRQPMELLLNDQHPDGLARLNQQLWLQTPEGISRLSMTIPLFELDRLEIPLPLTPHLVQFSGDGWKLEGLGENGVPEGQMQLNRIVEKSDAKADKTLEPGLLPPFVRVERNLRLGLEWSVETRVVRVSPPDRPILLAIPLLPGESVLSDGMRVEEGKVMINMATRQSQASWRSSLEQTPEIPLTAPRRSEWAETWRVETERMWHLEWQGLAPVHRGGSTQAEPLEWRPWPGETLTLSPTRPEGAPGPSLTLESSRLAITPGKRSSDGELHLILRSSRGGNHTLKIPADAELRVVTIDGRTQPIRQQGREVAIPLTPGKMEVMLEWVQPHGIDYRLASPAIDLGLASVNHHIDINLGYDRWVLFTNGPRLGPAVLWWGILLVILAAAIGLGRYTHTPLRTHHWLLLGIGLSQAPIGLAIIVPLWLLALERRARLAPESLISGRLNLIQIGLALLTLAALGSLVFAVQEGLLGLPDMQVAGNHSSAYALHWYQDRIGPQPPSALVISAPLLAYRLAMLAWALWLAFALLKWLRWGWECYSQGGLWWKLEFSLPKRKRRAEDEPGEG